MSRNTETGEIRVWDPFIRLFHWSLVLAFFTAYLTGDELDQVHRWTGYFIAGLLVLRILWGFVGSRHARFRDFLYPPGEIAAYLRGLFSGHPKRYLGHNPAGGLMVILLLVMLSLTTVTGVALDQYTPDAPWTGAVAFSWEEDDDDDEEHEAYEGPEWLEETHEFFANFTLLLVVLHIAGVVVSSRLHRENLVRAMITGRKPAAPEE